jgi:hypothetical protein
MLVNVMAIRSILLLFGILYGNLVYFVVILVYFSRFEMLYQEKSGNPKLRFLCMKWVLRCFVEAQKVERQNVERQNVKQQNVKRQNVERQNVE